MRATEIEMLVVESMLGDGELRPRRSTVDFNVVRVIGREFTGMGFLTEFEPSVELKLFDDGVSYRWGKVGARLNATQVETGYLVYVDDGYLTTIEGYTYGDEWPLEIEMIEPYEVKEGMELLHPPR